MQRNLHKPAAIVAGCCAVAALNQRNIANCASMRINSAENFGTGAGVWAGTAGLPTHVGLTVWVWNMATSC